MFKSRSIRGDATAFAVRYGPYAALFAIVLGGRWSVVDKFGTDLPEWDQWDAEGLHSLLPWMQHRLTLTEVVLAHNEHRVIVTKLLNLALTLANGQWDQRLECTVNAALAGLLAVGLLAIGRRCMGSGLFAPFFALVALSFSLPLAWQNVLGGFHSQQLFLIGFSLGAIVWLPGARSWSRPWWLGTACAFLALGTMASGLLAAAVVAGLVGFRLLRDKVGIRHVAPALVVCGMALAIGLMSQVDVPGHASLRAKGAQDLLLTLVRSLEWPARDTPVIAAVIWLPWAWLTVLVLWRSKSMDRPVARLLVGLGGWVFLQLLASAYARGAGGPLPASRYIDTLATGAVVNAMALGWIWKVRAPSKAIGLSVALLCATWACAFTAGIRAQMRTILSGDLPWVGTHHRSCEATVLGYIATGDAKRLWDGDVPYPDPAGFAERISHPELQALLPTSVRAPLAILPERVAGGFVRFDGRQALGAPLLPASPGEPRGVSISTPTLKDRVTWGSFGAVNGAEFSSSQLSARGGWLKFMVAGQLGREGVSLELHDSATGVLIEKVTPNLVPGDTWRSTYVPTPDNPFVVVARVSGPQDWMAFSEPVEMGTFSFWSWWAVRRGLPLAEAGAAAAVAIGLLGLGSASRGRGQGDEGGS
ncbi:MAG TPA: hypothetical protein VIJ19_11595 [Opitutaceae bacterium]